MRGRAEISGPRVRLFGGVEVEGPTGSSRFGGAKQRAIFTRLALEAGRAMSAELLIDDVWGDGAPPTVRASLQVHVAHIRRSLGEVGLGALLVSRPAGYALEIGTDDTDVGGFEQGLADARALIVDGQITEAFAAVSDSLDSWRGQLFADVGSAPFVPVHRARYEAVRVELACMAVELAVMRREPSDVLVWVEHAARDHPLDERLWCASARLLYMLNRQADAIERLATLRRTLLDELGLDPAPATLELELAILNQDPALRAGSHEARSTLVGPTTSQFPALRVLTGRDELVHRLERILADDSPRSGVITLVGPPGVGKTAVAAQVVAAHSQRFKERTVFVDLSAVAQGAAIWPLVAAAVGLKPSSPELAQQELVRALDRPDHVLVLDGCEHVVDDVKALLRELRGSTKVMATSRSPLRVPFEQVEVVEPLSPADMTTVFLSRARAADSRFDPTEDDNPAIHRIVEALDGLPLAAELMAPLVRSMTPHELANMLEHNDELGTQRRLRDATEVSVGLLDEAALQLLARISVFAGGTDIDGIRSVCGTDPRFEGQLANALVHALVEASLLVAERTSQGTWYRMLRPIRLVAEQRLDCARDVIERFQAAFLLAEVRRLSVLVEGDDPRPALEALDRHAANVRQVWRNLSVNSDIAARAELLGAFSPLALAASQRLPDVSAWLEEMMSAPEAYDGPFGLEITLNAAMMLGLEQDAYVSITSRAVRMAEARNDSRRLIIANALLTEAISYRDNVVAIEHAVRTLHVAREVGDPVLFALGVAFAVNPMIRVRAFDDARRALEETLAADTNTYGLMEPLVLYQAGRLELAEGHMERAKRHFRRAELVAGRTAASYGLPYALYGLAQVARIEGRTEDALALMHQVAAIDRTMAPTQVGVHHLWLAQLAFEVGDEDEVARCLTALGEPATPLEFVCEQTMRGFLALLRNITDVARSHFDEALATCAASTNVQLFIETANSWVLSLRADKTDDVRDVLADVAEHGRDLDDALQRLRGIAGA